MQLAPFAPCTAAGGLLASVTAAAGVAASPTTLPVPATGRVGTNQLRIQNQGAVTVYLNFGSATLAAAAVATGYPLLAGMTEVITIDPQATTVSTITGSGTANVAFTLGEGI